MRLLKLSLTVFFALYTGEVLTAQRQAAEGAESMVVSAQHYATDVGQAVLDKGGNAIDAAVAMGYALGVVHPCCGNIGGGGFMLIRFANGKTTFFNFREKAPLAIDPKLFATEGSSTWLSGGHLLGVAKKPYLSIGVPGTVKGLNTALQKYGTLSLADLLQPAIKLAAKGYILEEQDVGILNSVAPEMRKQPNLFQRFLRGKTSFHVGQRFAQTDLAKTLRKIAQGGSDEFYRGELTNDIVTSLQKKGGLLSKKDFSDYEVQEMTPLTCSYRGFDIIAAPPPSSGGVTICETLNILEGYPLEKSGYHSAQAVHYLIESLRYAYADRNSELGDPDFVDNPTPRLTSKNYAQKIRRKIQENKAGDSRKIGFNSTHSDTENTTSYAVVDKHGNAVSVTYTLNGYFGSKIIAGHTGFFLNNELADFTLRVGEANSFGLVQGEKNIIAPGKRPLSSMSPTIVTKKGKLFMVLGTPGGSTIPSQLVGVIQNVIDFDMNIQRAVDSPRIHMQWLPDKVYLEPLALTKENEGSLKKMGYDLVSGSPYGTPKWGAVMAILVDEKSGKLLGAADNRRPSGLAKGR